MVFFSFLASCDISHINGRKRAFFGRPTSCSPIQRRFRVPVGERSKRHKKCSQADGAEWANGRTRTDANDDDDRQERRRRSNKKLSAFQTNVCPGKAKRPTASQLSNRSFGFYPRHDFGASNVLEQVFAPRTTQNVSIVITKQTKLFLAKLKIVSTKVSGIQIAMIIAFFSFSDIVLIRVYHAINFLRQSILWRGYCKINSVIWEIRIDISFVGEKEKSELLTSSIIDFDF